MKAEEFLLRYDRSVQELAWLVRDMLLVELKGVTETVDESARMIGYGYGPGYKALVCTIIPSKKGVKLGFNRGSELPDPTGLLTGEGKVHRHVVIESAKMIASSPLKKLVRAGLAACRKRLAV